MMSRPYAEVIAIAFCATLVVREQCACIACALSEALPREPGW